MVLLLSACTITAAPIEVKEATIVMPYEVGMTFTPENQIDTIVAATLKKKGLHPANLCSDEVFIHRVCLDLTGQLPTGQEVRKFLKNPRKDKRATLVTQLLKDDSFADYWALKWCDILRVKAEFPINLWPNGVQAYYRWIHNAIHTNMPYYRFARELLTSSGSNFRVPQVNFYRAIQGTGPENIASAVALTFMGTRLESWPDEKQKQFQVFFSRVAYKGTAEWKEEIVYLDPSATEPVNATFPDGKTIIIQPDRDPRQVYADWLIQKDNPWFARNIVNRIWFWLMGRGIIHEPDDIRPDNPPVYPELLTFLEKELVESDYDLQHIYRLIVNSRIYQQSSIPWKEGPDAEKLFACYPLRRLDAEVLIDALCSITGTTERYSSPIPEPFTFVPEEHRSIELFDGSITSQFLELFGRPARDTGLELERNDTLTGAQCLYLLNSTHVQDKIYRSRHIQLLMRRAKWKRERIINQLYLEILSRYPTESESKIAADYLDPEKTKLRDGVNDLVWALINTKEFLYRH
jgi:hypothetical protein